VYNFDQSRHAPKHYAFDIPKSFCGGIAMERQEFYRRTDRAGESICLSCFQSVKETRWQKLDQAENAHRKECPNGMTVPGAAQYLWHKTKSTE
jgi:hypothetical protein